MRAQAALAVSMLTSRIAPDVVREDGDLTNRRTETKALSAYPVRELVAVLPKSLHSSIRKSKYYTANSDSLTFQAQTSRSRDANAQDNRNKLVEEVTRIYHEATPAETSEEKKKKHEAMLVCLRSRTRLNTLRKVARR
jgi:hypothetical protein